MCGIQEIKLKMKHSILRFEDIELADIIEDIIAIFDLFGSNF